MSIARAQAASRRLSPCVLASLTMPSCRRRAKHDAGTKALFGMRLAAHDNFNEGFGAWTNLGSLTHDTLRRPVGVAAMGARHVVGQRRVPAIAGPAHVTRNTLALLVEGLHRAGRKSHPQLLTHQRVRHRVVVLVNLDVIVDAGAAFLPGSELVGLLRQRFQFWLVEFFEQCLPAVASCRRRVPHDDDASHGY